jgi:hypothetical protein
MILDGVDIHYYTQPVESEDQATSLSSYLECHGFPNFMSAPDEIRIPMECNSDAEAADKSAQAHTLISTWRLFWKHSDAGVFQLPFYVKD